MTSITYCMPSKKRCRKILVTLLLFAFGFGTHLYSQKSVELPLKSYARGIANLLTPVIYVPEIQFQIPNAKVTLNGAALPPWLNFDAKPAGGDMDNDGVADFQVALFVPDGQCVPIPGGAGNCVAPATCAGVAEFGTALRRQCYSLEVEVYGTTSLHTLCVFGPPPITISGPANTAGNNGQTVSLDFTIDRVEENFTWTLDEGLPSYFVFTDATGKDAKITFTAPSTDLAEQTFHITVTSNIQPCDKATMTIKVSSKGDAVFTGGPVDIVLVVDVSGSMGERAECACKGQSGCPEPPSKTKLRYLKEQIKTLHGEMSKVARATDRIGLVSFHTTSKIEKNFVPFTDMSILAPVELWNDNGFDYTSIAAGLKDAVSLLNDPSRKRFIVLMTNGIQTEPPYLEWTDGSETFVKAGTTIFNAALGIRVIPIAIFTPTGNYRKMLNALGTGTGASVVKDVCESNFSLHQAFMEAAKPMGSPKIVTFKRSVFAGNVATTSFTVSENLDKLVASISNVGNQNFTSFKIEKNVGGVWTDITALGTVEPAIAQSSIRRMFHMNFPAILNGSPLNSSGDYRCTVTSSIPGIPYEFSVMIDDKGVKHSVFTGIEYNQAGEPINLAASVFFNGSPVTNANVVVSLESPIASFSSNFSRANISGVQVTKVPLSERNKTGGFGSPYIKQFTIKNAAIDALGLDGDRMSNSDRKYFVLRQEKNFGAVFQATGNIVTLVHQGNGIYKGQFTGTKNVGLYTMHFLVSGNVPTIGNITRMDAKDVFVNFGKPVLEKSNLNVMWEAPILLSFTPKDANDNLLGPGQADRISIYLSKGSASAVNDYLDGQYVVKLNGINSDDDPDIIIRIHKDVLYNGKLSGLSRKRWFVTVQAGYDYPQGSFGNSFKSNFMGELKLGYRAWKKLGVQAHLGYYSFKDKIAGGNQSLFGGGLGAFYRFPITTSQGWNMVAELNGGYYSPKTGSGGFGFNEGIGLNAFINYRMSLVLEVKYYTIYTNPNNMNFMSSTLGLKFHF